MPNISNINVGEVNYTIKDSYARSHMIDKDVNTDVSAIINFINGIRINGTAPFMGAVAEAIQVDTEEAAGVDLSINSNGIASFVFKIPRAKIAYISAFFSGDSLVFGNDDDYHAEFLNDEVILLGK